MHRDASCNLPSSIALAISCVDQHAPVHLPAPARACGSIPGLKHSPSVAGHGDWHVGLPW
eukprot:1712431-Lingulodinium_polyedra.AAC.1